MLLLILVVLHFGVTIFSFMYQRVVLVIGLLLKTNFSEEEIRKIVTPYSIHLLGWISNLFGLVVCYLTWREFPWYVAIIILITPFILGAKLPLPYSFFFTRIFEELNEREKELSLVSDYKEKMFLISVMGAWKKHPFLNKWLER